MVHHWTEDAVVLGMAPSTNEACLKLAKTMKVSYPTAFGWYQVGKVINENRLPFDSVGVSALRKNMAHISKATTLKCIQAIKDGARRGSVTRIIAKDRMYDKSLINARLSRLTRENKLTKTHLQMEMMALLTMARKVFKREDIIITITDTAFVPLCAVGDGKSGAEKNIA
jgi:hypothetical protein